jgi:hypothetical protein
MALSLDEFRRLLAKHANKLEKERFRHQRDRERTQHQLRATEDDLSSVADVALTLASVAELNDFRSQLDSYQAMTARALMENEASLAEVRENLEDMLQQAYVLPDGRRAFKTRDGLRVFDEHGQEVSADIVSPGIIRDTLPSWEEWSGEMRTHERLLERRTELLRFQSKLDAAAEALDEGGLTKQQLDELREGVEADIPDFLRKEAGLEGPSGATPAEPLARTYRRAASPPGRDDLQIGPVPTMN